MCAQTLFFKGVLIHARLLNVYMMKRTSRWAVVVGNKMVTQLQELFQLLVCD